MNCPKCDHEFDYEESPWQRLPYRLACAKCRHRWDCTPQNTEPLGLPADVQKGDWVELLRPGCTSAKTGRVYSVHQNGTCAIEEGTPEEIDAVDSLVQHFTFFDRTEIRKLEAAQCSVG